ncbi:MAG: CpaF family protein, partial [Acidimicrobiales bacterium]
EEFLDSLVADMLGYGPLTALMDDPDVTEIMCNAKDEIWVERRGRIEATEVRFASLAAYRLVIDRMLAIAGRRVDEAAPMADGRLLDGSRINAIIPPLVVGGPVLTIRRFPEQALTVTSLIAGESLSADAALFLEACVRGKLNVLVSGGTGTGKTTLLNVLSGFIPVDERVITIEDAAELRLAQPHVVTLEARPANIEGAGLIAIRDLVRNALRMRPDRIVVGEVRGGEALDMLQAMNTGHEGSLTTVHANTPRDALSRIETMVLMSGVELPLRAIREQVASALDLIVQLERRSDGSRVVSEIVEIQGREGDTITLQDVFARTATGPLHATGLRPRCAETLRERGVGLAPSLFRGHLDVSLGRKKS